MPPVLSPLTLKPLGHARNINTARGLLRKYMGKPVEVCLNLFSFYPNPAGEYHSTKGRYSRGPAWKLKESKP